MSSKNLAIRVSHLSKQYKLGGPQEPYNTLRDAIVNSLKKPFMRFHRVSPEEGFWALKDVSFDVEQGEVVGIIGRNGAGKSTLLKILSRITTPTEGTVELHGRVGSLLEVGTGFHPELTGRENVYLSGSIMGMKRREIDAKFDDIVKFSEIEKFLDTPVKRYSSGMYVRLAFAVAAHLEPEILLVDEVLAVGDVGFQKKCLGKMGDVAKEGRTVLFVSHNIGAIHNLCRQCILLDHGRVLQKGESNEVINFYVASNFKEISEYAQPHNASKPINLRRVVLLNSQGNPCSQFRFDEVNVKICIDYEVNENIIGCGVWFSIRTMEGITAFESTDLDVNLQSLNFRKKGFYHAIIPLPEKWLNHGSYYLLVGIVVYNPLIVYDRAETIQFSILDIGTPESIVGVKGREGIFQPFIKWDLIKDPIGRE